MRQFRLTELRPWEKWDHKIKVPGESLTNSKQQKRHTFIMGSLDIDSLQQDSISFIVHPKDDEMI